MQMRLSLKRTLASFCLGITLVGTGCTTEPVNSVQAPDQLSGLRLPGQNTPSNTPTSNTPIASPSAANPNAGSRVGLKNLLVWEVKPPQAGAPTSLLIGTAQSPLDARYTIPETFQTSLKNAQRFVMDADLSNTQELADAALKFAFDPERKNQGELSAAEWTALKERTKAASIPEQVLNIARPWYLNLLLDSPPADGTAPDTILDQVLRKQAETAKVSVAYLEKASDQLQALAEGIPEAKQTAVLKKTLANPPKDQIAERDKIITFYNQGSLSGLEGLDQEAFQEDPDYYAALVSNRNQKWLTGLEPVFAKERAVVAVGVLHLIGPRSLNALLTAKGYKVTPLAP